jgi:hypothetical protein
MHYADGYILVLVGMYAKMRIVPALGKFLRCGISSSRGWLLATSARTEVIPSVNLSR